MRAGTLFSDLLRLVEEPGLADLGPSRRLTAHTIPELEERLKPAFRDIRLTPGLKELLRGGIYLWHDHLEEAHAIAQEIETADGSLLHAIMHRREPDYFNSKYWFRRVGSHPSFLSLAMKASEFLEHSEASDVHTRLLPNKSWDPFAFVDAVEETLNGRFVSQGPLLQQLQKLEMECFLENLTNRI